MYKKGIAKIMAFIIIFQLCAGTSCYAMETSETAISVETDIEQQESEMIELLTERSEQQETSIKNSTSDLETTTDNEADDIESESKTEFETPPFSELESETEVQYSTEHTTEIETENETESATKPENTESELETESESEIKTETESESEIKTETENTIETDSNLESEIETEAEMETETETENEIQTESETEIQTDTAIESETIPLPDEEGAEVEAVEEGDPDYLYQAGGLKVMDSADSEIGQYAANSIHLMSEDGVSLAAERDLDQLAEIIYQGLIEKTESIDVKSYQFLYDGVDNKVLLMVYYAVVNDHPELYYVQTGYGVSYNEQTKIISVIKPKYFTNYDENAFFEGVRDARAVVKSGMTDLQKVIAVHDYIALNCEYDKERLASGVANVPKESYAAYGVFVNHIAVCQGYALAFKYLMNELGIECYIVTSDVKNHAWNMVKIDGEYYQLDITWDDPTWDKIGYVSHKNFLLSDAEMAKNGHGEADDGENIRGWYVTKGSGTVSIRAESTLYDTAFWRKITSPLVCNGTDYYYISENRIEKCVFSGNRFSDSTESLKETIGEWRSASGSLYPSAYSGLFLINNNLYFNTPTQIIKLNLSDKTETAVFTLEEEDSLSIYGSAYIDGSIKYAKRSTPNLSAKEQVFLVSQESVEKQKYTVLFLDYFGNEIKKAIVERGDSLTPPNFAIPAGYTMKGWRGNYTNIKRDETIQADYQPIAYKITYVLDGGTNAEQNLTSYTIETETFSFAPPSYQEGDLTFAGWYRDKDYKDKVVSIPTGSTGNITLYAKWEGIRIEGLFDRGYTGSAITFDTIKVYSGTNEIQLGADYTISYQNNINAAGTNAQKAPTVVVNAKGNYEGKYTKTFQITPIDIGADEKIIIEKKAVPYKKGKVQKPVPSVVWNGKKLVNNKDFIVSYNGTPINAGTYEVTITGKGNFTGTAKTTLTITDNTSKIAMSTVKIVQKIPDQEYTNSVRLSADMILLKSGKNQLVPGKDYSFAKYVYQGAGTHYVTICGKGDTYVGEMTTSFQIKGTKASSLKVGSVVYTGKTIKPIITDRYGTQLREGTDYRINALTGTESVGTAKINITGINAYYGTAAKSFKVTARPMDSADISASFVHEGTTQPYEKNGAKPKLIVKQGEKVLEQGVDYTLSYKNNKKPGETAIVTITGKKNFKGKRELQFEVGMGDLANTTVTVADKTVSSKVGGYLRTPVLKDANGNKLAAKTDYDKNIVYKCYGRELDKKTDKLPAGAEVTVEITGKGNYEGTKTTASYRILAANKDVSKASVRVNTKQYYSRRSVILAKNELTVKIGKTILSADDYEILPDTYVNNHKKGTAKVTIRGKGAYGGTKTISFRIYAQSLKK